MKTLLFAISVVAGAALSTAQAAPAVPAAPAAPVQTRDVPVNQFMQGRLPVQIPLTIPVPVDYQPAKIRKIGFSYWMRPDDAARASADSLPTRNGYMYGSTATNVTYDARHKVFYGIDDPGSLNKLRGAAANVQVRQFKEGKYPAVVLSMISGTTGQPAYFMYMATGVKNEVFYVSFRAPDGRPDIGDAVWAKLAAGIK
jgi:hypothetical protein